MARIEVYAGLGDTVNVYTTDPKPQGVDVAAVTDFVRGLDPGAVNDAVRNLIDSISDDPIAATLQVVADAIDEWGADT